MDEQTKLRMYAELFEIEENIARMEEARRQCIETWNRDIRAARKIARAKRNDIRSGAIQPELFDMLKSQ